MLGTRDQPDGGVFESLASPRRLLLVRYLCDRAGEAQLRKLSRDIVAHETGTPSEDIDDADVNRVYLSLHHTHVPTLAEHDVVEYDETERVVSLGERADEAIAVLQNRRRPPRHRWTLYYVLVCLPLCGVTVAGAYSPNVVPPSVVATTTLAAAGALFGLAAVHHHLSNRFQRSVDVLE